MYNQITKALSNHQYNMKNRSLLNFNHSRTRSEEKCLIYKRFELYNKIPERIKSENRFLHFKRKLKEYVKSLF